MAKTPRPLELARRMTPTDAMFWYAESALPVFRPIIGGLYILDRKPDADALESALDRAIHVVPRLRQRVLEAPLHLGMPEWVDDVHFDRSYHVRHFSVPQPGSMRELLDLVATFLATPLDRERPLWEVYWIDGLPRGRSAYFLKMHHAMVDGVGSIAIVNALTDDHGAAPTHMRRRRPAARRSQRERGTLARLADLAAHDARQSIRMARTAAGAPLRFLRDPVTSVRGIGGTLRSIGGLIADASQPAVHDPLADSAGGLSRRLDVLELPISRLRAIKKPLGVTINDLVLTVLAGALRNYHRERRAPVRALNCMVPMNLRTSGQSNSLGNQVGLFNIKLPLGERRPDRRLKEVVRQTRAAKDDHHGAIFPVLAELLTVTPAVVLGWLARRSLGRVNVACTNVPGLSERRSLAGAAVEAIYPFASVVEGTPVVMALLSYADRIDIGIDTDPEAIPEPHRLTELFEECLDEMEELARQAGPRGRSQASATPATA